MLPAGAQRDHAQRTEAFALLRRALDGTALRYDPTPVVLLNRAVALASLAALQTDLAEYQPFHATHADLLARTGNHPAARAA